MPSSLIIDAMYEEAATYEKRAADERLDDRTRERAQYKGRTLRASADRMQKQLDIANKAKA